ncbi:MAG: hypothetical protein GXP29_01430 [Planctomycetes bacterium]|nr:hypothetical protein [Planctomycetota bacterium]
MKKKYMQAVLVAISTLMVTGCESTGPTAKTFSYVRLTGVDRDAAFLAATGAMRLDYILARVDREEGTIRSVPEETEEEVTTPRVGDLVGVARRVRRIATAHITGNGKNSEVWCRVVLERNESNEHNLFAYDMQLDDTATETPADREAATTTAQNSIWRVVRRDKRAERQLLNNVRELVTNRAK